jgi:signal transduction histidine kinase
LYENKDEGYTIIYKTVILSDISDTTTYLQVAKDITYEMLFLDIIKVFMVTSCFAGLLFSIILGNIASKRILAPIDRITRTAQSITSKNLKQRIRVSSKEDELSRLATTFNEMIDRIQNYVDKQNQFVSDASHELRTPISVVNGYVNLLDRWGKEDKEILDESIIAIKNETKNMTNLLEKLLFLARSDSEIIKISKEKFYLNELVSDVIRESNLVQSNKQIKSNITDETIIKADIELIKQLLRIFIDNSIKFTDNNGVIEINLLKHDNECKLIVKDNGVGIPKENLNKVFDRFYMADHSREKHKGGSGLGLSIPKQIVLSHRGEIKVESKLRTEKLDGGTIITVTLPI